MDENKPSETASQTPKFDVKNKKVTDLRAVIIQRLNEKVENKDLQRKEIIGAAEEFFSSMQKIHNAVMDILNVRGLPQFIETLKVSCEQNFGVFDAILVLGKNNIEKGGNAPHPGMVLVRKQIMLRYSQPDGGSEDTGIILRPIAKSLAPRAKALIGSGSEVVFKLDLGRGKVPALLIFSSENAEEFSSDQATDLFHFFRQVVALQLALWLDI